MSCIKTISIPPQAEGVCPYIIEGDTIKSFSLTAPASFDLTGASVKCQLYKDGVLALDLATGNGLTLSGQVITFDEIPAVDNNLSEGVYFGDIEVTLANGQVITIFRITYTILKEYTI